MKLQKSRPHRPVITVSAPAHTIPQTPLPLHANLNPFANMTAPASWETLVDERIALAKECQKSDSSETLEKLLLSPTFDSVTQHGADSDSKVAIRGLHKETVHTARKAYDVFHELIENLKKEKPKDDWEEKIGAAGLMAKDAFAAALARFAGDAKDVISRHAAASSDNEAQQQQEEEAEEGQRVENAQYFSYCVNGYVLFVRKANEALELVYEARKGGQQRVWTALETAGRIVHDAEVAALKWVAGQNAFASSSSSQGVSFRT